jgi:hypothetical protein
MQNRGASASAVIAGLDPAIHPFCKKALMRRRWTRGSSPRVTLRGLFTSAVGICSMVGAGGKMAVAVSPVFVGGKPVAQALKGLIPKRFTAD